MTDERSWHILDRQNQSSRWPGARVKRIRDEAVRMKSEDLSLRRSSNVESANKHLRQKVFELVVEKFNMTGKT